MRSQQAEHYIITFHNNVLFHLRLTLIVMADMLSVHELITLLRLQRVSAE
jgi:hypothetical protein